MTWAKSSMLCAIWCEAVRPMFKATRLLPNDLPPWHIVYQQTQRWLQAGCFEHRAHDLRALLPMTQGRNSQPSAAILDSRTLQGTAESACHSRKCLSQRLRWLQEKERLQSSFGRRHFGAPAGFDRDTGQSGRSHPSPNAVPTGARSHRRQHPTGLRYQGYSGDDAAQVAQEHGVQLEVVKLSS